MSRLRQLIESGELVRVAARCRTADEVAHRLGYSSGDILSRRLRELRARGIAAPVLDTILGRPRKNPVSEQVAGLVVDQWDEPTHPGDNEAMRALMGEPTGPEPEPADMPFAAVPDGFHVRGLSTYHGQDGVPRGQWVKASRDAEDQFKAFAEAVAQIAEPMRGAVDPSPAPAVDHSDLMNVLPIGDPHIGMYAWAKETGQDFDLAIAERNLATAIDHLLGAAPRAEACVVAPMGDTFHFDWSGKKSLWHGHTFDAAGQYTELPHVAMRFVRRAIDRALERHGRVIVKPVRGNHDVHSSYWLAMCIAALYEREPRVEVDTSPDPFLWLRFGRNLLGWTHSDETKPANLAGVVACDRAVDWGQTLHRHVYCGHLHHTAVQEVNGVVLEWLRTLAPRDRYGHGKGYRSGQDVVLDTWHREYGRIGRAAIGIGQVMALQGAA